MSQSTATPENFQAAIAERPTDPQLRLIYADYLEETGVSSYATLMRQAATELTTQAKADKDAAARTRSAKLHPLVVLLGERYHAAIDDLYTSKRGDVVYGHGGHENLDWDAYGKRGYVNPHTGRKQPAKWKDAGARLDSEVKPTCIILESHLGHEKARLPLTPLRLAAARRVLSGGALVHGDLYGVRREIAGIAVVTRFGWTPARGKTPGRYHQTGIALQLPVPEYCREQGRDTWGIFRTTEAAYWEHGRTVADCRTEYRRKLKLAEEKRVAAALSEKMARAAKRIAASWKDLVCTVADARAVGYCVPGIEGFAARFGLAGQTETTAATLRATGDSMVERVIQAAAERTAKALFAARRK